MSNYLRVGVKFGIFATVMALLTASLFVVFAQYRTGATNTFSAVFRDVSGLQAGEDIGGRQGDRPESGLLPQLL